MPRESKGSKQRRARAVATALRQTYPRSTCALDHRTPFQLLVATMLSAQTTDRKVNEVTPVLFARWPDAHALAAADEAKVAQTVRTIGLWRSKARNIVAASRLLVEENGGEVPRTLQEMVRLPGVGRKTATAVLGTAYGIPAGVTVDTHMLRIHRLLRLSAARDADRMARDLEALLPPEEWPSYTHRIIDHGRLVCVANRPRCGVCVLAERDLCPGAMDPAAGYRPQNDVREPASATAASWLARRS